MNLDFTKGQLSTNISIYSSDNIQSNKIRVTRFIQTTYNQTKFQQQTIKQASNIRNYN